MELATHSPRRIGTGKKARTYSSVELTGQFSVCRSFCTSTEITKAYPRYKWRKRSNERRGMGGSVSTDILNWAEK